MQAGKRSIIIGVDNRAKDLTEDSNLNYIDRNNIDALTDYIRSDIITNVTIHQDRIDEFLRQFHEQGF